MSKRSGLSQLADAANELLRPADTHYPVKKRREKRVLNPNWLGIAHLEAQALGDTEIIGEYPVNDDFLQLRASGFYQARREGMYPRPVFQVFDLDISSSARISYTDPCPACDDWSRTARCEEHHDRDGVAGLKLGQQRREERYSAANESQPTGVSGMIRQTLERQAALYASVVEAPESRRARETRCTCSMCQPRYAELGDPNQGGPRYRYSAMQDRWVPVTADPAADSLRYAMPPYRDVRSYDTQIDWETVDRVPQELLDRIGRLPSFTLTVEGTFEPGAFLEVTGETEQGTGSFAIEVEPNDD